jgi:hypothetical protein
MQEIFPRVGVNRIIKHSIAYSICGCEKRTFHLLRIAIRLIFCEIRFCAPNRAIHFYGGKKRLLQMLNFCSLQNEATQLRAKECSSVPDPLF